MVAEGGLRSLKMGVSPFERVFSSKGRVRILYLLTKYGMLNITRLSREAELSYESTKRHLRELVDANTVLEQKFGRIRIFSINKDSPMGRKVIKLFSELD